MRVVVAFGGNALLRRGESLTAAGALEDAVRLLAGAAGTRIGDMP